MSLMPGGEPESALSVIPEATEENFGSSALFHFRLSKTKVVPDEPVDAAAPETLLPTKYTSHTRDGEANQFRTVVLVSKQPYSSCCCVTF